LLQQQQACKRATTSATHLINASITASKSITNPQSQTQLSNQTRIVADETIPHIVQAMRAVMQTRPGDDSTASHLALIAAAQEMIQVRTGANRYSVTESL
jgi:hypothetical protein